MDLSALYKKDLNDWTHVEFMLFESLNQHDHDDIVKYQESRQCFQKEGIELGKRLAEFVNAENSDAVAAFVDCITRRTHRTLQQGIMRLFVRLCEAWAKVGEQGEGWYDLRNECTIKAAPKIVDVFHGGLPPLI
jgi:hypothetical protein